jgi:malate dehydrogenase (oxaloacetate-decarboxylating)(NADP+)
MPIPVFHDD